jgi:hypothetical protein
MTHVRRQIRDTAVTAATGLTTTGSRVFSTRLFPLGQADLPCWVVSTDGDEAAQIITIGTTPKLERSLALEFNGFARAIADLDDTLDGMCAELEAVIVPSAFSMVKEMWLESTEFQVSADELDNLFGVVTLTYRVIYHVNQGAPETAV